MFLTERELKQLTGYDRKREQVRHLSEIGVKFVVNRLGKPQVSRRAVEDILGVRPNGNDAAEPDYQAMDEVFNHGQKANNK